ncbi:MAG: glycosyltransferase, partial [Acidimicrobiia bacterium]|nr:glycosyltransferase [Acidimicrobiia bacterium]
SYVMLEAMASGRSVVATDVGGAREALGAEDDRTAGVLVPPEDPDALAAATVARLLDRDLAGREGAEGVARARARHDRRRWLSSMDDITTATMNPVPSGVLRP